MQYEEKQQLKLWWLYILLGVETVMVTSILFLRKGGMSLDELKANNFLPILTILLPYLIVYLINQNSFTFRMNEKEISYHYWPFAKRKLISWEEIDQAYFRKYDALGEYGGWGFRYKLWFKKNDKAYIFNDEQMGLQLVLKNGKKLLFSTKNLSELTLFLINIQQKYHIGAIATDVR